MVSKIMLTLLIITALILAIVATKWYMKDKVIIGSAFEEYFKAFAVFFGIFGAIAVTAHEALMAIATYLTIGLGILAIYLFNTAKQNAESAQQKYIIGSVCTVLAIGLFFGGETDNNESINKNKFNSSQNQITTQTQQNTNQFKQNKQNQEIENHTASNNHEVNNKASADISNFIVAKNQYDQDIAALAGDINSHLSVNPDFTNASHLISRAENIKSKIISTKQQVNNANITNIALKDKLLEVLDTERTRVDGLIEGMNASRNGGSHIHGFKRGTDAAYRFDNVNAELNRLLR